MFDQTLSNVIVWLMIYTEHLDINVVQTSWHVAVDTM